MTLPNIKEMRSAAIIERFGVEGTIDALDNDADRLLEINGITPARLELIKKAWDDDRKLRELYVWLSDHGIPPKIGKKIYETWKEDSLSILAENPYRIIEIKGVGFKTADLMAHRIFDKVPKDYRTVACMQYLLLEDLHKNSNLCMPFSALKEATVKLIHECDEANNKKSELTEYKKLISQCIRDNLDIFAGVKNVEEENNRGYIYLRYVWDREKYIAREMYKRKSYDLGSWGGCDDHDIEKAEADISKFSLNGITLDDCQKEAIKSAFENKVTVITGGGGTGKSTICRAIVYLAQEKGLSLRLMSPTGKAAQVLSDKTHYGAATIHRSLLLRPGDDFPREKICEDIIIVDEVSMVGVDTMFAVMFAMEENPWANVIFVGDSNQLPSVSPGNFLSNIMSSGCANVVKLNKIHRQDENSYISLLANEISKGRVVDIPEDATDIKWHACYSDEFGEIIKGAVKKFINDGNDVDDLQIIAPMYKGEYGVNNINEAIQEMMMELNGVQDEHVQLGFNKFYLYDRVIQLENNYDKEVFNGDIGKIVQLGERVIDATKNDKPEYFMVVNFYGEEKLYSGEEFEQLKPAWCITVHKYQGSQAPYIIFVMSNEARIMMNKELVYTAFTRAEKHLDIFGHLDMLEVAPSKSIVRKRYTNFNSIIKQLREQRKILQVLQ